MPRRGALNAIERSESHERCRIGLGHDMSASTLENGRAIPAIQARKREPSPEMREHVQAVRSFIREAGGLQDTVIVDVRYNRHPGCLTIRWHGGPTVKDVATQFAIGTLDDPDGLPVLPGWLSLKRDDEFDLRWQITYGHPDQHPTCPQEQEDAPAPPAEEVKAPKARRRK